MKVLLFGHGYVGGLIRAAYPGAVNPKVDIADPVAVSKVLDKEKPDIVINAAGRTGRPNVDWCEDHKPETLRSNVTGPLVLLEECAKRSIYWANIGSGCIYEGDNGGRGFTEEDRPNFFGSFYARSKLWIDQILRDFPVLQLRLRMPFDGSAEPRNLIMKLKNYPRVLDAQNSLTYTPDLIAALQALVAKRATGIYNVTNPGSISPWQMMQKYQEIVDPSHNVERITLKDLPGVVKAGRSNCILSTGKLEKEGIRLRPVEQAVEESLRMLAGAKPQ